MIVPFLTGFNFGNDNLFNLNQIKINNNHFNNK